MIEEEQTEIIIDKGYSKLSNIKDNGDGTISYIETYNLDHPQCPIVCIKINDGKLIHYAEQRIISKFRFELFHGKLNNE